MFLRKWIRDTYSNTNRLISVEFNKLILKSLLSNQVFSNRERFYFYYLLKRYSINSSVSIYRRFCVLTGYSKSVFRYFKLSRHQCKKYAADGLLIGMRKSSF